jgi:hypothetical protein
MGDFDNAPTHNAEEVHEYLANVRAQKNEHPPYSPDSTLWNFFLFGAIKEQFAGHYFDSLDGLFVPVESFLSALSDDFLGTSF